MADRRLEVAKAMLARARANYDEVCSDDCISPPGLTVTYHGVTRTDPILVCTEKDGHEGPHVARGYDDLAITSWARGQGRAG